MVVAIHILACRHRLIWCDYWIIFWRGVESVLLGGVIWVNGLNVVIDCLIF